MNHVTIRTRTLEGVRIGCYYVTNPEKLKELEIKKKGVRILEQAIYASGLMINPFDVVEASLTCDEKTYRYVVNNE